LESCLAYGSEQMAKDVDARLVYLIHYFMLKYNLV